MRQELWYAFQFQCVLVLSHDIIPSPSQENILSGLAAKQPKTVAGCVAAVKEIVR